ncbi:sirohydrochlorin chelatase [Glycomyces tarimensis]
MSETARRARPEAAQLERALVLVAHGSPDPRSGEVVRAIAHAAGARVGFLEFNEPDPVSVLTDLADEGTEHAVALPLLLTDAYHAQTDLPEVARRAAEARPGLRVDVARPVGDESLTGALLRDLPEGVDGIVVCAAGTRVDAGRAHVHHIAERLASRTGIKALAGFASGPGLKPEQAVAQLRSAGAARVAAVCYFIAPGVLCDAAVESARSAGVVHVGEPLGPAPELLSVIAARAAAR